MSIVTSEANAYLDQLLGTVGRLPNPFFIGLMLSRPNYDGSGVVEPAGANGYARVSIANNPTEWPAAVNRTKVHTSNIIFPAATAAWGNILYAGAYKTALGNDLVLFAPLDFPRVINPTDVFRFLAASSPFKVIIPAN